MFKKNSLCANLFYVFLFSDTAAAVFVQMQLSSVIVALYSNCHYCSIPMQHCVVIAALSSARIVNVYEGILAIYVVGSLWYIELIQGACLLLVTISNSWIITSVGHFECINSDTHNTF